MSEVNLNLIDTHSILHGRIHGSIADAAVAALSAEPETIAELDNALTRYIKPITADSMFASFHTSSEVDDVSWDAGVVIIDLAARIVAAESTYSMPGPDGEVRYHDGTQATEVAVLYRVPADWNFVYSLEEYYAVCDR